MTAVASPGPPLFRGTRWRSLRKTTEDEGAVAFECTIEDFFSELEEIPPLWLGDLEHPGWSAAIFEPLKRNAESVVGMTAVVLDYEGDPKPADGSPPVKGATIEQAAELWAGYQGCIYTTRKHAPTEHRFRLILTASRIMTAEEYAKLWLWAADKCGRARQRIDPKARDTCRFWFLPGVKRGSEYRTLRLQGASIDVDRVLGELRYAEHAKEPEHRQPTAPFDGVSVLEKLFRARGWLLRKISKGYVAVCPWEADHTTGTRGDTSTLLYPALHDSKFGHLHCSHAHCIGRTYRDVFTLFSASELRAAGYEPRPERVRSAEPPIDPGDPHEGAPIDRRPIGEDDDAPKQSRRRKDDDDETWKSFLGTTEKGYVSSSYGNIVSILRHRYVLGFDEVKLAETITTQPGDLMHPTKPGVQKLNLTLPLTRPLSDADIGRIREQIEQEFGQASSPSIEKLTNAIVQIAHERPTHPVRLYLESLKWDGHHRIDRVAESILDVSTTSSETPFALCQTMIRRWFIGAVARPFHPGCKLDTSLVLLGPQGARKSMFFDVLGGEWYSNTITDVGQKDGLMQIHAAWIYEWAEIDGITRTRDAAIVKKVLSSAVDSFRLPYARKITNNKRSGVIVGTTNESRFLSDPSGSRRFWVVPTGAYINIDELRDWRDQLWAEAVVAYKADEPWWLTPEEEKIRAPAAEQFEEVDPWETLISTWLESDDYKKLLFAKEAITTHVILAKACQLKADHLHSGHSRRAAAILERLGWTQQFHRTDGGRRGTRLLRTWRRFGRDVGDAE